MLDHSLLTQGLSTDAFSVQAATSYYSDVQICHDGVHHFILCLAFCLIYFKYFGIILIISLWLYVLFFLFEVDCSDIVVQPG